MDPSYIQKLHNLLQQSTAPDTALIKAATATLNKDFYRDAQCVPGLFEIIVSSPEPTIRQFAAVELRKRIAQKDGALWTKNSQDVRETIKSKSLEIILSEQVPIVRHSVARIIAAIAEIEPTNWPALLPWLNQTTSSPTVAQREVGTYVLFSSLETIIDSSPAMLHQFLQHFSSLLQDPESLEVRQTALRSMGTFAQFIDTDQKAEIATFQTLVPAMVAVIGGAIEQGATDAVRHGVDVFETLLILEVPLLSKHIPNIVEFFTSVGANRNVDDDIRIMALNALTWTIKYKKSRVQALNLAKPILEALVVIGAEDEPEDVEEDSPSRIAFRAIDALATALPPTQVFLPLMTLVETYGQSPDPNLRKSALTSFGVAVEGCSEFMRPHIRKIWPLIDAGFQDASPLVRKATCIAFGCLCEWLEDECIERHAVLMPALMNLMNDPESQSSACTALDAYLEVLGPEIAVYLDTIMTRLSGLLESGVTRVKSLVTGAIGSAAHASGRSFQPYFQQTLARLQPFFSLVQEGEEQELRGIAMDALGTIAEAIGKEEFSPYFSQSMNMAFQSMELGSARLRECAFLLFGVLSRLFEADFAPYLQTVIPALIESCKQNEGSADMQAFREGIEGALEGRTETLNSGEDVEINVDDDDEDDHTLAVNSAIAVEKEIAADTMGTIFAAVGEPFLPYLEPATQELVTLLDHYYEGIRKSACSSLLEFVRTFYALSNPELWIPGLTVVHPLHEKVQDLIKMIMTSLLAMWETEDDKTVASNLCQGLSETMTKVGPGFIQGHLDEICTLTVQILEKKSLAQQDPDQDDEDDDDEEQAEYESVLISTASDVVASLATVLGPDFQMAFGTFMPLILKYYTKNRSASDRSSSIGSLGEIITGMKGGVTQFTEPLLDHIFKALSDEEPEVRSNAAFAAGVLVENSDMDLAPHYLNLLAGLRPFFVVAPGAPGPQFNARDNAAGAVSRMIVKNTAAVPLDQVLPVLFGALPLEHDFLENRPVFAAIFHLFLTNSAVVQPYIDQLLPVFVTVLDPGASDQIGDEVRHQLIELIRALNAQMPDKIAASGLQVFCS